MLAPRMIGGGGGPPWADGELLLLLFVDGEEEEVFELGEPPWTGLVLLLYGEEDPGLEG